MEEIQILLDQLKVIEQRIEAFRNDESELNAEEKITKFNEQKCRLLDRMVAQVNDVTDYDYLEEIRVPRLSLALVISEEADKLERINSVLKSKSLVTNNNRNIENKINMISHHITRLSDDMALIKLLNCPTEDFITAIARDFGINSGYKYISTNERIMILEKTRLNEALSDFYEVTSVMAYLRLSGIKVPLKYKYTKIAEIPNTYKLRDNILINDSEKQRVEFNDLYHELAGAFFRNKSEVDLYDYKSNMPIIFQDDKDDLYARVCEYMRLIEDLKTAKTVEQCVINADNNVEINELEKEYNKLVDSLMSSGEREEIEHKIAKLEANKSFFGMKNRQKKVSELKAKLEANQTESNTARKIKKEILLKYYMHISTQLEAKNIKSDMFFGSESYAELQRSLKSENCNCLINMAIDGHSMSIGSEKAGLSYPFRGLVSAATAKLDGYYKQGFMNEKNKIDINKCDRYIEMYETNRTLNNNFVSTALYINSERESYCIEKCLTIISNEYIEGKKQVKGKTKVYCVN